MRQSGLDQAQQTSGKLRPRPPPRQEPGRRPETEEGGDEAAANAKKQVAAASSAQQSAEQAAQPAQSTAKVMAERAAGPRSRSSRPQPTRPPSARGRRGKTVLSQAQAAHQNPQSWPTRGAEAGRATRRRKWPTRLGKREEPDRCRTPALAAAEKAAEDVAKARREASRRQPSGR